MAAEQKVTWVTELDSHPWKVNKDLLDERKTATFNPIALTYVIDGSKERTENRRQIQLLVYNDPDLQHVDIRYMTRDERYQNALNKSILVVKKQRELGLDDEYDKHIYRSTAFGLEPAPFSLHYVMFMPALSGQGTQEQQDKWLTLAEQHRIIGTYAQTEIGHGTYVRGVETTATYDADTDEFVINSPTPTSTKFWPGGLGLTSNHAVVVAQLHTDGAPRGVHTFIVQIRSGLDHKPLPGITVGDIGPKNGYESNDNGFLSLDHVRVPRTNMLMRNAEVVRGGRYVSKPAGDRLTLATMMFVRAMLVNDMGRHLGKACTIATRYSAVRRQGPAVIATRDAEEKLLNYQTQQHKLFPQLASAYVYIFLGNRMRWIYFSSIGKILDGEVHLLPELHALSAGLKAIATSDVAEGIEACRECCGGHGFSQSSGFNLLYNLAAPSTTYEGDNIVLLLQTARYLMKCYKSVESVGAGESSPPLSPSVEYLSSPVHPPAGGAGGGPTLGGLEAVIDLYRFTAYWSIVSAYTALNHMVQVDGVRYDVAWDHMGPRLVTAARAHCQYYIISSFADMMSDVDHSLRHILIQLCHLYSLHNLRRYTSDVITASATYNHYSQVAGGGGSMMLSSVHDETRRVVESIRPDAVALVDALDFHDLSLHSVLGCYDGHVYDRLLSWAKESPMNQSDVHPGYEKYLRPFLDEQERMYSSQGQGDHTQQGRRSKL